MTKVLKRLREIWKARPIATAIVVAALLMSPSLAIGFFADDLWHVSMLEGGDPPSRGMTGLYHFTHGGREAQAQRIARGGMFGWWTDPTTEVRFLRPASSALTATDHVLFGRNPLPYKIHSWLWYLAVVGAVGLLHRRLASPRVAALATLIFAIDDVHEQVASWIASRHALIATLPAVLGILAHLRARENGFRAGRVLAPLAFVFALAAGETGVPALAFLLAYEIAGAKDDLRARAIGLAPFVAIGVAYAVIYKTGGYGVHGSGAYLDPLAQPLVYATALPARVAVLSEDLLAGLASELWSMEPLSRWVTVPLGVLAIVALFVLTRAVASRREADETRHVRWLALAAAMSILPVSSGFMGSRVLLVPSIATSVLVASVLVHGAGHLRGLPRFLARWLAVVHLVLAPANCLVVHWFQSRIASDTARVARGIDPAAKHVYAIGSTDPFLMFITPYAIRLDGRQPSFHALSIARRTHRLTRTGERTLEIAVVDGRLLETEYEHVFRTDEPPMRVGDEIKLVGGVIRVLAVDGPGATRFELVTDDTLDDVHLLAWRGSDFERILLRVGESVDVPWTRGPSRF